MSKVKQVFVYISLSLVLCALSFLVGMKVQQSRLSAQSNTTNKQQETTDVLQETTTVLQETTDVLQETTTVLQETTTVPQETTVGQKDYYAEIDSEYKQQLLNAVSNVEVSKVHDRFTELWKSEIDSSINKINAIASESLQQALFKEQQEWESTATAMIDCRLCFYQQVYGSGSIVPVLMAEYKCQLYRDRAISLNEMYDQI